MSFINKKKLFLVVSLFASASLLAQGYGYKNSDMKKDQSTEQRKPYDQGHVVDKGQLLGAYNAPARIDPQGSWDFYVTASYIYWLAKEKGLDYAITTPTEGNIDTVQGELVNLGTDYKSAFKVGLGWNSEHDDWDIYGEYTWFHKNFNSSKSVPTNTTMEPIFYSAARGGSYQASVTSLHWEPRLDFLKLEFARAEYVGTHLTFRPHMGLRGGWIKQAVDQVSNITSPYEVNDLSSHSKSKSWFIGPRMGVDTNWIFGYGVRMFGNTALTVPYQRIKVWTKQYSLTSPARLAVNIKDVKNQINPQAELAAGLGWGMYWGKCVHFDLAASYEFQYLWAQNAIRALIDERQIRKDENPGALMLHGLTITARLDF